MQENNIYKVIRVKSTRQCNKWKMANINKDMKNVSKEILKKTLVWHVILK